VFDDDEQFNPLQVSKIECDRNTGVCIEAKAEMRIPSVPVLNVWLETHKIAKMINRTEAWR
jgi:hypothetical protein